MSNAEVIHDAWVLPVVVTDPATPSGGDPCRWGFLTGVAVDDENAAGVTVVDFGQRVHTLHTHDRVGGGIALGDTLYYADATNDIDNVTTGTPFGYAYSTLGAGLDGNVNVLHVPGHGAATLGAGVIGAANLAASAVEEAKINNLAVTSGKLGASAVTAAKLAAEAVTGAKVAESANADVLGAVPLLYHASIADGSGNTDIVVTSKIQVVDFWIVATGAAGHAADDHVKLTNQTAGQDITEEVAKTATVNSIKHATTILAAGATVADGATLRFTAVKATNVACEAYVLAYRIA